MADLEQQERDLEKEIHDKLIELAKIKAQVMDYPFPQALGDACAVLFSVDSTMWSYPKKDYLEFQERLSDHMNSLCKGKEKKEDVERQNTNALLRAALKKADETRSPAMLFGKAMLNSKNREDISETIQKVEKLIECYAGEGKFSLKIAKSDDPLLNADFVVKSDETRNIVISHLRRKGFFVTDNSFYSLQAYRIRW